MFAEAPRFAQAALSHSALAQADPARHTSRCVCCVGQATGGSTGSSGSALTAAEHSAKSARENFVISAERSQGKKW